MTTDEGMSLAATDREGRRLRAIIDSTQRTPEERLQALTELARLAAKMAVVDELESNEGGH